MVVKYLKFLRQNVELISPEKLYPKTCWDPNGLVVLGLVAPGEVQAIAYEVGALSRFALHLVVAKIMGESTVDTYEKS